MDPEIHDAPMYAQTFVWSILLAFGFVVTVWLVSVIGETVEHFTQ